MGRGIIRGAMQGFGEATEKVGVDMLRAAILEQRDAKLNQYQSTRDERTAQLARETHAANAELDIQNLPRRAAAETTALVDREKALQPVRLETKEKEAEIETRKENAKAKVVPAGSSVLQDGQITLTAPSDKPAELLDYYDALAGRLRAETKAIEQGTRYGGQRTKAEKPILPKAKVVEEGDSKYIVDEHSGAVGRIVPAQKGTPGEKNLIFADKPGTPDVPARVEWTLDGRVLQRGLAELYPALSERMGGAGGAGGSTMPDVAPVPGARRAPDGKWYVEREGKHYPVIEAPQPEQKPATQPAPQRAPAASAASVEPQPTGAGTAETILRSGGVSALLSELRKKYPPIDQRGRGGVSIGSSDAPEVQRIKSLTGPDLLREANKLLQLSR